MGTMLEKDEKIAKGKLDLGQTVASTLGKITQARKDAGPTAYCFLLLIGVRKAHDTVWRNGLWKNMLENGITGNMWGMTKNATECMCENCCHTGRGNIQILYVDILQVVARGCTLSPHIQGIYILMT